MVRLLRDHIIQLAGEKEVELGIQHVKLHMENGNTLETYVTDFEMIEEDINPRDITRIEVLDS